MVDYEGAAEGESFGADILKLSPPLATLLIIFDLSKSSTLVISAFPLVSFIT